MRLILIILLLPVLCYAQSTDTLITKKLEEVVVTATRNERALAALPMPVTLINKSQIKTMGSLRLNDVLAEQSGLAVVPQVNGVGNGLQLQGFDPGYTLILVDGEPLIGRNTGSLELSRISVGNIKQVEIVKGPCSSLYGSEALAGVVNIITSRPQGTRGNLSARYGTFNTLDLSGDASVQKNKLGIFVFANRYATDGYNLSTAPHGQTVSPFSNYTGNTKLVYKFNPKTEVSISARGFQESQQLSFDVVASPTDKIFTTGQAQLSDWNINPVVTHRFSSRLKTVVRFYSTHYKSQTNLSIPASNSAYYHDDFGQSFTRPEVNAEYFMNQKNILTLGVGTIFESVQTSRYGDESQRKQQTSYAFFQHEWLPIENFQLITGGRYDRNSVYGSQFSPKLSSLWRITRSITLKGSFGVGFKSPDFRQLYLNFNNSAAGGYSVLGTEIVADRLNQLESQGLITTYLFDPNRIGKLQAESSRAFNFGANFSPVQKLSVDVNFFRNDIDNLIETQIVAITTSNRNIYSYRNLHRVFTQGLEANIGYPIFKHINATVGYQLLYAKDKDVLNQIKGGMIYSRDPVTYATTQLSSADYFGLFNRSRHMGNFKIFYNHKEKGIEGSVRVIYRGKYGAGSLQGNIQGISPPVTDTNGNGILDRYDNFVSGYFLINLSAAKTFKQKFRMQAGIDNLLDHKEPQYIPNLPGRIIYFSINYSFSKKQTQ